MKKLLPLFFTVCSLALIGVGVWNLTGGRASAGTAPSPSGDAPAAAAPAAAESGFSGDTKALLDVAIPGGIPSQVKDYTGFRLSFNKDNRTPNWVAWELLASETDGATSRSNNFWLDEDLDGCPGTWDYKKSGYDRGHLCPAADMKWSPDAMQDCFVMANICPQDHALNSGAWSTLEKKERQWAQLDSALLIVAGPIYADSDTKRIGEAGVRVPGAFFKVIAAPGLAEPRGIAFVYPNMTSPGNMENYVMTIDEVEKLTGYDFFSALPDGLEDRIESVSSFREWNRR